MIRRYLYTIVLLLNICLVEILGQADTERPLPPVFTYLTVQPGTGFTLLKWQKSPSPDVAGYVVYYFRNGEGFAIDTIKDPEAVSWSNPDSRSSYFGESYVVAAIDTAGNISPLSNQLHTIFLESVIDSCRKKIDLAWNSYLSVPNTVTGYRIIMSRNGEDFTEAGVTPSSTTSFIINTFETDIQYCFIVEAILETGNPSESNKSCITTEMQRAPDWINADYATVDTDDNISLSFTCDPFSEITRYRIQRKGAAESEFTDLAEVSSSGGKVEFTDNSADPNVKYSFRLAAINNCGIPIVYSNIASNLVASLDLADNVITIGWNTYKNWLGGVAEYRIFIRTGEEFYEKSIISPPDTSYSLNYADIMFDISGSEVCFYVVAKEEINEHNIAGESRSGIVCTPINENVYIANAFTPDNDNINDFFKPVFSFTPADYHFIVTDRRNSILFESRSENESWDGKPNGNEVAQGVYLWFLRVVTPSGKIITRSGTVTILKNRL